MYEAFYGLTRKPFELHPDPDYVYMSPVHDDVYTHLRFATEAAKGFVVITGEIGSGKTTLINYLVRRVPQRLQVAIFSNTSVPPVQFLHLVCDELNLGAKRGKVGALRALREHLLQCSRDGVRLILVIDEAQNLPMRTLEELRMLSNLGAQNEHVLQIILVGQPELRQKLQQKELEQLLQRVTVHWHLGKLARDDVGRYVAHRLRVAGADGRPIFDEGALEAVYRHSGGTPRLINILCDTALVFGFGEEKATIDERLIEDVVNARQAGGLFCEPLPNTAPSEVSEPEPAATENLEWMTALERRVRHVETLLDSFGKKLENLDIADRQLALMFKSLRLQMEERRSVPPPASAPARGHGEAEPISPSREPLLRRIWGGKQ